MVQSMYASDAARWAAVSSRSPNADGCFVYCVKTTKIFCRPICQARLARRSNVEFFDNVFDAEAAGYRACKRCKPTLDKFVPNSDTMIRKVCRTLDELPLGASIPSLQALACEAGMTKYHFHRSFKKLTGLTPRDYAISKQQNQDNADSRLDSTPDLLTPALIDDLSVLSGAAPTPQYAPELLNGPADQDYFDLDDFLHFDGFDWQDILMPELDSYIDGFITK